MCSTNTKLALVCVTLLLGTLGIIITIVMVLLKPTVNKVGSGGSQTVNNEMSLLNLDLTSSEIDNSPNSNDHSHTNYYLGLAFLAIIVILLKSYIIKNCINKRCTNKPNQTQDTEMNNLENQHPQPLANPPPPPRYMEQADYSHLLPYLVGELARVQAALDTSHATPVGELARVQATLDTSQATPV